VRVVAAVAVDWLTQLRTHPRDRARPRQAATAVRPRRDATRDTPWRTFEASHAAAPLHNNINITIGTASPQDALK
jgi:hypothetical protein